MLIKVQGQIYVQETGRTNDTSQTAIPYPDHAFVQTTWAKWKQAHPETDIYVGVRPAPADTAGP
jgi:hypothetical protein